MLKLNDNKTDNSKIKCFKQCPRMYFYEHVLGWRSQMPNNHLVFGSAWHEAMEHLLLQGYGEKSILEAYDKFLTYYRTYLGPETDDLFKGKTPDTAFRALAQYAGYGPYQRDFEKFETLFTEIAGSVAIDEKHSLFFRMDGVLRNQKTGQIRAREHKTGTSSWLWDEQWLLDGQPSTYSHVLNCLYPSEEIDCVEMNAVFFPNVKKKPDSEKIMHRFEIKRTMQQMQSWMNNTRYYLWELDREYALLEDAKESDEILSAFPIRDTSCLNYFRLCSYHDFCCAWRNPLQYAFEPPIGFKEEFWDPTEQPATKTFNIGQEGEVIDENSMEKKG